MKRFTETAKWNDAWFSELSPAHKLVWLYVVDSCDCAGIVEMNFRLVKVLIGVEFEPAEFLKVAGERIQVLAEGKWFITTFIEFQYGRDLTMNNTAHVGVLRRLEAAGLNCPVLVEGKGVKKAEKLEKEKPAAGEKRMQKPTLEQLKLAMVKAGCPETEAETFFNYYESNGWRVGRNPMKSWGGAVANWAKNYRARVNHPRSGYSAPVRVNPVDRPTGGFV